MLLYHKLWKSYWAGTLPQEFRDVLELHPFEQTKLFIVPDHKSLIKEDEPFEFEAFHPFNYYAIEQLSSHQTPSGSRKFLSFYQVASYDEIKKFDVYPQVKPEDLKQGFYMTLISERNGGFFLHDPSDNMTESVSLLMNQTLRICLNGRGYTEENYNFTPSPSQVKKSKLNAADFVRPIVYCSTNKISKNQSYMGREFGGYSHRFDRRGTWRKIRGIGKNQLGEYIEAGRTWVKSHIVGPEDKPYVQKTRVISNFEQTIKE